MSDSADKVEDAAERLWEATATLSAAANRIGTGGSSATITQQSSTPILISGIILAMGAVGLLCYDIGARKATEQTIADMKDTIAEQKQKIELREIFDTRHEARLNALEHPPKEK